MDDRRGTGCRGAAARPRVSVEAPDLIHAPRLVLRRPRPEDTESIFARYASDPEVTRFVGWPVHTSVDETRKFLAFSAEEWEQWLAGPYVVRVRAGGSLVAARGLVVRDAPARDDRLRAGARRLGAGLRDRNAPGDARSRAGLRGARCGASTRSATRSTRRRPGCSRSAALRARACYGGTPSSRACPPSNPRTSFATRSCSALKT